MTDSQNQPIAQIPVANGEHGISIVQDLLDFGLISEAEAIQYLRNLTSGRQLPQPG